MALFSAFTLFKATACALLFDLAEAGGDGLHLADEIGLRGCEPVDLALVSAVSLPVFLASASVRSDAVMKVPSSGIAPNRDHALGAADFGEGQQFRVEAGDDVAREQGATTSRFQACRAQVVSIGRYALKPFR